ncbi:uncharacterized protein LOC128724956 [Anopheles nili]|uniref:uncharacterized protein LOC128724956 n=1 Tax=Anopheles nili TaxID=185578 RepID=UPI00237BAE5A|nr:uncharacterized protein LOC128724956 [Anopheles nili]
MMSIHLRMVSMTHTLYVSLESVVLVRRVLDHSLSSIGLMQGPTSMFLWLAVENATFYFALKNSPGTRNDRGDDINNQSGQRDTIIQQTNVLPISRSSNSPAKPNPTQLTMFKLIVLTLACLAVAVSAQYWGGAGYGYSGEHYGHHHDYYSHPSYKFEYGVKDPHTGDHKSQWEHRDGDVVKGAYTLHEADGTERVVEYSSDKHNGFQAHVKRVGHAYHPAVYGHHGGYYGGYNHGHGAGYSYSKLDQHF